MGHRIFTTAFADVYPHYVAKVERKERTVAELHEVIRWLTGFTEAELAEQIESKATFEEFFGASAIPVEAELITGSICGVKIVEIEDPLMKQIRQLDKLVDELAKGRPMAKILRG